MNLEEFEKARPPRRAQMDLVLTRGERHRLLVEWGASGQDVIEAIRMIIRVKNQRRQTVNNLGSYDRIEEVFENLVRSARRVICQSSSGSAAKKLQEDSVRAASMKKMQASGQATSFTANETLTASTVPKRGQNNRAGNLKDVHPPCQEVSVHKDFETCSNSDAGEEVPSREVIPEETLLKNAPNVHLLEMLQSTALNFLPALMALKTPFKSMGLMSMRAKLSMRFQLMNLAITQPKHCLA